MPYVAMNAKKYVGQSVGDGQCVAYARVAAAIPHTGTWRRGEQVRGAKLAVGTAIATFDEDGNYENDTHGRSHAAIYLGQDASGIQVLDQWVAKRKLANGSIVREARPVGTRTITFKLHAMAVNNGNKYYVIE